MHIRLYRQLSVCITEKHVKILAKPFNRYDDQSADADPNVVFAWQSGHRPRQRGLTYGLNGAFPSQLQPALLNIYKWASVELHQFLGHQSRGGTSVGAYQQPPKPTTESSPVPVGTRQSTVQEYPSVSHEIWRPSNMGPRRAEPSDAAGCSFLPPVTQKSFTVPINTKPSFQYQPLSSILANCSRYPTSEIRTGQKRKHETFSLSEDRGGEMATTLTTRKRLQRSDLPCGSVYLNHHEFPAANTGNMQPCEESRYVSMSRRNGTLAEMPGQHINATRRGVAKNIPIWINKSDSWRQTEFESEDPDPTLIAGYNGESGNQAETTESKFKAGYNVTSTNLGAFKAGTNLRGTERLTEIRLDDMFYYDANYKVLICKYHGQGVVGLEGHLKDAHNLRKKEERQPFLDRYAGLAIAKPQDVALPPMNGPPFHALREPSPGFYCIECGHLSTSQKSMQGHCNKKHKWRVTKQDPTHWTTVMVQTFFEGSNLRYFIVRVGSDALVRT